VGDLSYKLQLPAGSKLYPVFHVSQLRRDPPAEEVHQELPQVTDEAVPLHVPEQIPQTRQVPRRQGHLDQALIQWTRLPVSLATWENVVELKARFPRALAWGKAAAKGGENVICPTGNGPEDGPRPRPSRAKRPNVRYPTHQWTT
jgi:hypothetical protein